MTTYGSWTGVLHLERSTTGTTEDWQVLRSWKSRADRNVSATGIEEQDVYLRLRAQSGMSGAAASGVDVPRFILEAADSRTYGLVKVTSVADPAEGDDGVSSCMVDVVRVLGASTATTLWAEGAWSKERGYPAAVGLHEARLWFGGSKHQPQTLWASCRAILRISGARRWMTARWR